jgi:hypothetical protein
MTEYGMIDRRKMRNVALQETITKMLKWVQPIIPMGGWKNVEVEK